MEELANYKDNSEIKFGMLCRTEDEAKTFCNYKRKRFDTIYNGQVNSIKGRCKMRLPQEIFAEALWVEWFVNSNICKKKLSDLLRKYNLKLKREKTLDDIKLSIGKALKNTPCVSSKQIERIAEEIDKVCIIANWEDAVAKYKVGLSVEKSDL